MAYIALVVLPFLEPVVFLLLVLVELVVGVPGAPDAAAGLEEPHVGLERERDAGAPGSSGSASRRNAGRREEQGGADRA
jgi:hypothetical protein